MGTRPYYLDVATQTIDGDYVINKFGHNEAVGTTPVPISHGSIYRTPQVAGATRLRVKAGDANDTAAGTGARSVFIEGIDSNGYAVSEVLPTAGLSAGANSVNSYIRLYRAYIYESGAYGSQTTGSHTADVVIENAAGTEDWAIIELDSAGFADGQTEIGAFTVPKGYNCYMLDVRYSVDSTKVSKIFFYKRENILDTSAPYKAIRKQFGISAAVQDGEFKFPTPLKFGELTDIGFLGLIDAGTATMSVEFNLVLRKIRNE